MATMTKEPKAGQPIKCTHNHTPRMVELATKWLYEYFSDGKARKPGDLEDDFCGQFSIMQTPWRASPFYPALAQLVHDGKIVFGMMHSNDHTDGDYWYSIPGKLPKGVEEA